MIDQVPHPFAPFQPSPSIAPDQPKAETAKQETAKQKAAREKREKAAAKKEDAQIEKRNAANAGAAPTTRKPRGPNKAKALKAHSPKFDIQTTLAAAQLLNEGDFPLFEKLVVALDEAGKPARDRVLGALGKVFG